MCQAWRVAPLAEYTPQMIEERNFIIVWLFIVGLGLAGNEELRSFKMGKLALHIWLILLLVLCCCILFLWNSGTFP